MKKRTIIVVASVILLIAIVGGLIFLLIPKEKQVAKALKPDNKEYDKVQISVNMQTTDLLSEDQVEKEETNIATIQKDNDLIFESSDSGKYYFYTRDEKDYVMLLDDMSGMLDKGTWTEVPANEFSINIAFDFRRLKEISADDLYFNGQYYVPITEKLEPIFSSLLNISQDNIKNYKIASLQLEIKDERIAKINANYAFNNEIEIQQSFVFSYNNISLELPKEQTVETNK